MEKVASFVATGASFVAMFEAGMSHMSAVFFAMSFGLSLWVGIRNVQIDKERKEAQKERNFHYWKAQDAALRLSLNGEMLRDLQFQNMVTSEGHALLNERQKANTIAIREWGKEHAMPPIPRDEGPYVTEPTK